MSEFFQFLNGLQNPEKSRNFASIDSYNLERFQSAWNQIYKKYATNHHPIRVGIVGTNGKGSLAYYLGELCRLHSVPYGQYTSPHFHTPNERIAINGDPVSTQILDLIYNSLNSDDLMCIQELSYFEVMTIFAAIVFSIQRVDIEIIEAGLGGRLDATKLFSSETIAITKIGLDHMEILGNTEEKILLEKLGVTTNFTKRIIALEPSGEKANILKKIIKNYCRDNSLSLEFIPESSPEDKNYLSIYQRMSFRIFSDIHTPVYKSWINVPWLGNPKGRLETLQENPLILYDTAHNPQAVENLLNNSIRTNPGRDWIILLGTLPDKDLIGIIEKIQTYASSVQEIAILSFPPFKDQAESIIQSKKWTTGTPIRFLVNNEELSDYINANKNFTRILSMGSFRIYPLLKRILGLD